MCELTKEEYIIIYDVMEWTLRRVLKERVKKSA